MLSWASPVVPVLPGGEGGEVRIHDSVSGRMVAVGPDRGEARLYACGITPYDATHLGHAATYVGIDLLHRAWLDAGLRVRYAQNVTDVDDPLVERAQLVGIGWADLAAGEIQRYRDDMAALRVIPPVDLAGVVENLGVITDLIEVLRQAGAVYQVSDADFPDWYFSVGDVRALLAGTDLSVQQADQVFAERGGDPDRSGKRHRLDPLVWRLARPGEPSWASDLGAGRPGWHVECTAIALAALGPSFDVQAGGRDLSFPHHRMCAAQALSATGQRFAQTFIHAGMVGLDGQKMSKSLGNLVFVNRLLGEGVEPMAIRLVLLANHYRSDWEYHDQLLAAARTRLGRWRDAVARPTGPSAQTLLARVRQAIGSDLDAPTALALVDDWAATPGDDPAASALVRDLVDGLLGVRL